MAAESNLTRERPLVPEDSALLIVDVQNLCARRDGGEFKARSDAEIARDYAAYFAQLEEVAVPNMQRLLKAFRAASVEVLYTTIESLTRDGRDRSLDYKISGFNVPKGAWDAKVIDELAPEDDEMVFPKSSSSVFISTNIDYVLRNLGVKQLVICGLRTDHCVESAIRDACDLGYLVTQVTDACASITQERHENSLRTIKGYCRQVTTEALLAELPC
ncbi:isochorismatase family cysteine hydrolase [Denitrobaculum tricleocarpae]|uniref:Cysteine hydrolase n=1 Tax=Denitrobaculum tricleocarpae TaxID=2591009 RepID=A0A545TL88_9PROT|nr:isochorismatase family cysteine hydrolase [Denitrobaculum tricleocarpae]TQV77931.1 cysteine hydrolase [Denitrobaculum tricleocarpae]